MADPVTPAEAGAPPEGVPTEEREAARRRLLPQHDYSRRFRAAYIALAIAFWAIVGGGTYLLTHGTRSATGDWSTWRPSGSGLDAASQIAAHVAPQYRAEDGSQLVAVQAHQPEIQNVPLAAVALRNGGDVKVIPTNHAVVYVLCGIGGQRCSIATGKPTVARATLLRREALELALYTFKYVKGVDSVIALLPPPPNSTTNWSVYFRKGDVRPQLDHALRSTLPESGKLKPSNRIETATVESLTRPRWFRSQFQQLQDGDAILVLDPLTQTS